MLLSDPKCGMERATALGKGLKGLAPVRLCLVLKSVIPSLMGKNQLADDEYYRPKGPDVNWLLSVADEEKVINLLRKHRGMLVSIPNKMPSRDPQSVSGYSSPSNFTTIVSMLGEEVAALIIERWFSEKWHAPIGRKVIILWLWRNGVPVRDIAAELGCSQRNIFRVIASERKRIAVADPTNSEQCKNAREEGINR